MQSNDQQQSGEQQPSSDTSKNGGGDGFKPIESQEDLNAIIGERVSRERAKFSDYEDLKAKAVRLDEIEQANKTEAEKSSERITALEQELAQTKTEALRSRVQARFAISDDDASLFLTGNDEATLTKQAERLAEHVADRKKHGNLAPFQGRTPSNSGASSPWSSVLAELDERRQS